jgi:hypothetical protein
VTDVSMQNVKSLKRLTWQKLTEDPGQQELAAVRQLHQVLCG